MIGDSQKQILRIMLCMAVFLVPAVASADIDTSFADRTAEVVNFLLVAELLSVIVCIVANIVFLKSAIHRAVGIALALLCMPLPWLIGFFVFPGNPPFAARPDFAILAIGLPILVTVVFVIFVLRDGKKPAGSNVANS